MDRFRKNYTPVTNDQKDLVLAIKGKAEELEALIQSASSYDHRLASIALHELEETVMWAVKAATTEIATVPE